MVGPAGAGKTEFVNSTFSAHEVVSMDAIRYELTGDKNSRHVNSLVDTEYLNRIKNKLLLGERVVADSNHVARKDRLAVASIGADLHVPVIYIVINRPLDEKLALIGYDDGYIEKQENTFKSQEKDIAKGDGTATVIDIRVSKQDGAEDVDVVEKFNFYDIEKDLKDRNFNGEPAQCFIDIRKISV